MSAHYCLVVAVNTSEGAAPASASPAPSTSMAAPAPRVVPTAASASAAKELASAVVHAHEGAESATHFHGHPIGVTRTISNSSGVAGWGGNGGSNHRLDIRPPPTLDASPPSGPASASATMGAK